MQIEPCTLADYFQILADLPDFWGSERTRGVHHAMFVREFGDSAFVVRDGGRVVAYLFGFCSQTEPVGYIHLVAVRGAYQRQGLARRLYEHFIRFARGRGCREIKATARPDNRQSIAFHTSLGMHMTGAPNGDGVPVVKDYGAPGEERVVFRMPIVGESPCESAPPGGS
jgi:GNAT superfamily N-acetyltransferase